MTIKASTMTEDKARTTWCPHVRMSHNGSNRWPNTDDPLGLLFGCECFASRCSQWRWADEQPSGIGYQAHNIPHDKNALGYCGLAGKP
jgi:hypothetical protein